MYEKSLAWRFSAGIRGIPFDGDMETVRRLGEGVDCADAVSE